MADFNFELIFCYYIKALAYSVKAERIIEEVLNSLHPEYHKLKTAQESLIEASKITEFISIHCLGLLPVEFKSINKIIPELNPNIMEAFSKLFYAEAQLVAYERGIAMEQNKLGFSTRAALLKDIVILLRSSWEFLDNGFAELKSSMQSSLKPYYIHFIKGLTIFCDGLAWFNYGLKFQDEQPNKQDNEYSMKMRLGCEKIAIQIFKEFEDKHYQKLEKHRIFFESNLKKISEQINSY